MSERTGSSVSERKGRPPDPVDPEIARRLIEARTRLGMSASALAKALQVSKAAVSAWERSKGNISPRHVAAVSFLLDIPVHHLISVPRGTVRLTDQERAMLEIFRRLSPERRASLLIALQET